MARSVERFGTLSYSVVVPPGRDSGGDGGSSSASAPLPGPARTVLLVHGFGSNYAMNWEAPGWPWALRDYAARIIGVDVRGHGASVKSYDPALYTPEALVGDLIAVLDAEGLEQVDVIGYSMGSRLTWELAVRHPSRVRRAVLGGFGPRPLTADDDDAFTENLEFAAQLPSNDLDALRACAAGQIAHLFDASAGVPKAPILFTAGDRDSLAEGVEGLADRVPGAAVLRLPRRDHRSAVSARAFKNAAVEFLSADDPDEGVS